MWVTSTETLISQPHRRQSNAVCMIGSVIAQDKKSTRQGILAFYPGGCAQESLVHNTTTLEPPQPGSDPPTLVCQLCLSCFAATATSGQGRHVGVWGYGVVEACHFRRSYIQRCSAAAMEGEIRQFMQPL